MSHAITNQTFLKIDIPVIAVIAASIAFLFLPFYDGIEFMVKRWMGREEYSHGFFLPVIALYLLWERRHIVARQPHTGSYAGPLLAFAGLVFCLIGELATIYEALEYGYVVTIWGIVLSIAGVRSFRFYVMPLLILFFMIPLPNFIFHNLSSQLQLISSRIGVSIIHLFDIPVYLEGNVIDLGSLKLQVVEACSGLRYLFPLMTLGFILGYMFHAPLIFRCLIFISSIPVTILMNSFRIGLIGVTVEYWGQQAAEGILHDFEGWAVFMSSLLIIIGEMWLIARLLGDKRPLPDLLNTAGSGASVSDAGEQSTGSDAQARHLKLRTPFYITLAVILVMTVVVLTVPHRDDRVPDHASFASFPMEFSGWQGNRSFLQPMYLEALKLTDYVMADYSRPGQDTVNLYVAYYDSQKKGRSAHSPKSCIPGDGWEISEFGQQVVSVNDQAGVNHPVRIPVNRAVISKGQHRSLVYYWFQQRGRFITNEYLVKWYLLTDALLMARTDGAMIRLTTQVSRFEDMEAADNRIQKLMADVYPHLTQHIPE